MPVSTVDKDVYAVTIAGEYYIVPENGRKGIKRYQVTIPMSGAAKQVGFLSAARNRHLPRALKANYPDYKRFRTHEIIHVENKSRPGTAPKELALMNRKQLVNLIIRHELEIEPDLFPQISDLRQAVKECRSNPEAFATFQAKRMDALGPWIAVDREIEELCGNIDLPNPNVEIDKPIPVDAVAPRSKRKVKVQSIAVEDELEDEEEPDAMTLEDEINQAVSGF